MWFSNEITLIASQYKTDNIGNQVEEATERTVYADSVGLPQSEYFTAAQSGIKAQGKVKVWGEEYHGETQARYNGALLDIYRTYPLDDGTIELYLKAVVGNEQAQSQA